MTDTTTQDREALRATAEAVVSEFSTEEERAKCSSCGEYLDTSDTSPLYECGDCGSEFTRDNSDYGSHRCSCGKYASKKADYGCNDCDAECELVVVFLCVECNDDTVFEGEDDVVVHLIDEHEELLREQEV